MKKLFVLVIIVLFYINLSGCAIHNNRTGYTEMYDVNREKMQEEPYHSLPYKLLEIATGSDSLKDGVDGKTGKPNGLYPEYDSVQWSQAKDVTSGAFSAGLLFSNGSNMLGTGLLTFMLSHGSDPAAYPVLIFVSNPFDASQIDEEVLEEKKLSFFRKNSEKIGLAINSVVQNMPWNNEFHKEGSAVFSLKNKGVACKERCEYVDFIELTKNSKCWGVYLGSSYQETEKDSFYHLIPIRLTSGNPNGNIDVLEWNTSELHPLRDYYVPISENLPDNAFLYVSASHSFVGHPVMLHKGQVLSWNVPHKKPSASLQAKN